MFYTATYTDKKDEEFALSLGAERFLVKPVESNRFMEIIDGILKDYKKGLLPPSEMPTEKGKAVYLEEYNERLINKLEKKMLDLESKIIEHKLAEDEIRKLNEELEQRVSERTSQLNESKEALLNLVDDLNIASDDLKSANERLQELDHLKSMFIASMSHELRTPLNSIIGFTGIILQGMTGEINPEQRNQLQRVYGSAKHLLALINDVIDISKIEAGKFEVHVEEFSLDGVIREAVSNLTPEITDKGLDLEISLPQDTRLTTDRKRLLQCVLNFLSNAVKFTEKGEIKVAAHEVDGMMEIAVKDTGIGIKKEDLPRLFGSFVRLDSALTIKTTGTGLGLYLTRKIATEMLGGEVSVKSTYGKGSTFILKVPKEI
ncbi:MAG: HAMP domain-containing histidine kinase [Deltaproteobacteria bacterium]|nr:HAMP domain-containing histidine kinase [Deltaproteobacteria bacterium]